MKVSQAALELEQLFIYYLGKGRPQMEELEKDVSSGEFVPRVRRIHAGTGNPQQQLGNR